MKSGPPNVVRGHGLLRRRIRDAGGLTEDLRREAAGMILVIEDWCRTRGLEPDTIPPLSRRAYEGLCRIAAGDGVAADAAPRGRPAGRYRVARIGPTLDLFLERLSASRTADVRETFAADLAAWHGATDARLARHGIARRDVPFSDQWGLGRLDAWCEEPWGTVIPAAAAVFETELARHLPRGLFSPAWRVRYLPSDKRLWHLRKAGGGIEISVSDFFLLDAGGEVPRRLAALLGGGRVRKAAERAFLRAWIHSEEVVAYVLRIGRDCRPDPAEAAGVVRDLAALYRDINERYFAGRLRAGGLAWTRRVAHCRTGYYDPLTDAIFISSALDDEAVPACVAEFVLYHEMLHQESRLDLLHGRGRVHDAAFRARERRHESYDVAEAFLKKLALRN